MTCSVYGTVAVALNRYFEMTEKFTNRPEWMKNGKLHCLLVVVISVVFNFSRFFELESVIDYEDETSLWSPHNVTLRATNLRLNENYVRWYSCIINSIVMIVIPTSVLVYTSYKVTKILDTNVLGNTGLNDERSKARVKRNQSITRMLIGIVVMFLVCHTGKVNQFLKVSTCSL